MICWGTNWQQILLIPTLYFRSFVCTTCDEPHQAIGIGWLFITVEFKW